MRGKAAHQTLTSVWRNEMGYAGSKATITAIKANVENSGIKIYYNY